MRIVVVGGGPTGVELAGAFAELSRRVLAKDFKNIRPERAHILLLEIAPRILLPFSERLSESARRQLVQLGVDVRLEQNIKDIQKGAVILEDDRIEAENIFWGAGVRASAICEGLGAQTNKAGQVKVEPDLSIPGHPEIFAVGDIVSLVDARGKAVPGVSPAAMQMGKHVAKLLKREVRKRSGSGKRPPFTYFDKGNMATIGRSKAIAQVGRLEFSGWPAWLAWLFVHLVFLIGFRNKLAVLLQWFYSYITFRRGARIITGLDRIFRIRNPKARPVSRAVEESL